MDVSEACKERERRWGAYLGVCGAFWVCPMYVRRDWLVGSFCKPLLEIKGSASGTLSPDKSEVR